MSKQTKNILISISISFAFLLISEGLNYLRKSNPELLLEVLTNNDVISINEKVEGLKILYNNKDLRESNEKLIILNIKIENIGNKGINESDYYSKVPFGFELKNAKIIKSPKLIKTSNTFLDDNIDLFLKNDNQIHISKIPLEVNDFFIIKIEAIIKNNIDPNLNPIGYINGAKNGIKVISSYQSQGKSTYTRSWLESIFYYFGIFVFLTIICLILINFINNSKSQRPIDKSFRNDLIKKLKQKHTIDLPDNIYNLIINTYLETGDDFLYYLNHDAFNNPTTLKIIISRINNGEPINELLNFKHGEEEALSQLLIILLESNLLSDVETDIKISVELRNEINKLEGLIRATGESLLEK
ncbi:hypothetical protein [Snuella sedimenti]|uniref:Uncharacterized protein n=1 Tax=Snuella sedimenti TaxID=2798802 RepID=A0A8J7J3H4_9FLAO|nr:hypothetical protein [Snuella sedimenti]MBJ6367718.1 hypothetical protein [Snuella sedimenti]